MEGSSSPNSLAYLTSKFISFIKNKHQNQFVSISDVASQLRVQKRRLYDIINVLEGVGILEKNGEGGSQISIRFKEFPSSLSSGNEIASGSGQDDTIGPMLLRLQQLKGEEEALDQDLSFLSESISQTCSKSTSHLYVTKDDICKLFPRDQVTDVADNVDDVANANEEDEAIVPLVLTMNSPQNSSLLYNEEQTSGGHSSIVVASSNKESPLTAKILSSFPNPSEKKIRLCLKEIQGFYDDSYQYEMRPNEGPSDIFDISSGASSLSLKKSLDEFVKGYGDAESWKRMAYKLQTKDGNFVDMKIVAIKGGKGGDGITAQSKISRRSGFRPATGGKGGNGGQVYIVSDPRISSLRHIPSFVVGKEGLNGRRELQEGATGPDISLRIPVGTILKEDNSRMARQCNLFLDNYCMQRLAEEENEEKERKEEEHRLLVEEISKSGDVDVSTDLVEERVKASNVVVNLKPNYQQIMMMKRKEWQRELLPIESDLDYMNILTHNSNHAEEARLVKGLLLDFGAESCADLPLKSFDVDVKHKILRYQARIDACIRYGSDPLCSEFDFNEPGLKVLVARGGKPGLGNAYGQPHLIYGHPGEYRYFSLELKTVADVGLVGLPNAGKSSFLSSVSKANPRIAPYPFTTLNPYIGTITFEESSPNNTSETHGNKLTIADIPGIIMGAHLNLGLGFSFLRHIERSKVLVYVIDVSRPQPHLDLYTLLRELEQYNPDLLKKPSLVIANKIDRFETQEEAEKVVSELKERIPSVLQQHLTVFGTSAKYGFATDLVIQALRNLAKQ